MSAVVILGMHRSGTSLVAKIFHKSGISMGQTFLQADHFNPNGYFEDEDFLNVNKSLLETAEGSWKYPPEKYQLKKIQGKFESSIVDLINSKEETAQTGLWGWKDPRTCLTNWIFHRKLIQPKYIVVTRNKVDMIQSLENSRGKTFDWSNLIEIYENSIWTFLRDFSAKYTIINYNNLVNKELSTGELRSLALFLEVEKTDRFLHSINFIRFKKDLA